MSAPTSADPWAGLGPVQHITTRDDRKRDIALFLYDTTVNDTAEADRLAERILNVTYPVVRTADELDALEVGTVVLNEAGRVYTRAVIGGLWKVDGSDVGTLEVWEQPGQHELGRKPKRTTSATLAATGPWTIVHRVTA